MFNVYSDGACIHNQRSRGCGGYGYVIINDKTIYENKGTIKSKTSNEMELIAVIAALKDVIKISKPNPAVVQLVTDSNYIVQNWQKNLARWIDNGWKTKKGTAVANQGYWKLFLEMAHDLAFISVNWCRGHSDNKHQNRAHALAKEAVDGRSKMSEKSSSTK